ncbi:MAG: hypothetical protein ABEI99_03565, partial [Halobaculum sp.]
VTLEKQVLQRPQTNNSSGSSNATTAPLDDLRRDSPGSLAGSEVAGSLTTTGSSAVGVRASGPTGGARQAATARRTEPVTTGLVG